MAADEAVCAGDENEGVRWDSGVFAVEFERCCHPGRILDGWQQMLRMEAGVTFKAKTEENHNGGETE